MFAAFRERRPWAAALVNFVFGPVLGMLYLNRGQNACLYWLGTVLVAGSCLALWPALVSENMSGTVYLIELPIHVIGGVHGFLLGKRWSPETQLKWYAHWYGAIGVSLILPTLLALGIRTFFYQSFDILSASMTPTIRRGDYFWVSKRAYDFSPPQRGDIVVFFVPALKNHFVKRIVGLPGDRVQMIHGRLSINGTIVPTRRLQDVVGECATDEVCRAAQYEEAYPAGNTGRFLDQVSEGPLDDTDNFLVPEASYFVLGDNRDNSNDSREGIGFVPRSTIVGKAAYKYISGGHWVWQSIN